MCSTSMAGESPTWVAAVALIDTSGRVLVQRRRIAGEHGGLWEFPGGKLEQGESPETAAIRELSEELAVSVSIHDLRPVGFTTGSTRAEAGSRPLVILLFASTVWKGAPQAHAASDLAWCDPRDLRTWQMPPLDYPLADALSKLIAAGAI